MSLLDFFRRKPRPPKHIPVPVPAPKPPVTAVTATVYWINESPMQLPLETAETIVAALNVQAPSLALAWGKPLVTHILSPTASIIPATAIKAYWLPNSDVADALGYHDVDPYGDPYIRVFTEPVLNNGGTLLSGAISVSVCSSHEACELDVDPLCVSSAVAPNGVVWALETADPVESNFYSVTLPGVGGQVVSVSDFVFPAFFSTGPGPYDAMGVIKAPFTMAPGGYSIQNNTAVFAEMADLTPFPAWKQAMKLAPGSRTWKRTHPAV